MSELIRLTYRKYDRSLHWHGTMRRLGEDEHGLWLGWGRNMRMARGSGPVVTFDQAHVQLIRRADWWCGAFHAAPRPTAIYCDITTVAEWTAPDEITMVDLDLDVLRFRDGRAPAIVDEDEFLEHQVRYGYPPDVIASARATADALLVAIQQGEEPFNSAYQSWLSLVEDVDGDPISVLADFNGR
jgi:protein associated with RNAse G/E